VQSRSPCFRCVRGNAPTLAVSRPHGRSQLGRLSRGVGSRVVRPGLVLADVAVEQVRVAQGASPCPLGAAELGARRRLGRGGPRDAKVTPRSLTAACRAPPLPRTLLPTLWGASPCPLGAAELEHQSARRGRTRAPVRSDFSRLSEPPTCYLLLATCYEWLLLPILPQGSTVA
jgi:hypothetical protein